jgi:hypothetical protein
MKKLGFLIAATAATATTTAVGTTTTATATAVGTTTTTTAATSLFTWAGLIDGKWASIDKATIQLPDGSLRLGLVGHIDKAESLALAGETVLDNIGIGHTTMGLK